MDWKEAVHEIQMNTHTVWTIGHGYELAEALGLPKTVVTVRNFDEFAAADTGDPKGFYPNNPSEPQYGVSSMDLAIDAIRFYDLPDTGAGFLGRGFAVRARMDTVAEHLAKEKVD